ncbi:ligand-binding sensor domain-containing protein [Fodinibius salinus]|uniref:Ligand-binding sensor domain-containing protein n=1 Tax=Fodinibius salinus TaxID=860790 RepID=A0A5D3YN45_9BACT|nr:sensor histidine kinase [Fodinibius salinus]TYP95556.1 ligand-binding sensor domain-containing protein [Fodinibius salinus]
MKRLLLFIFLIVTAGAVQAQTFPFRTYSIERGLSEAVVNDLMQDNDGYLWIGTSYGLNRFDGFQFKNYYAEDGLLSNKILSLYEDSANRLWIGTGSGVNIMKEDSVHVLSKLSPLESSTILDIHEDQQGEFWFATDGEGVWHLDGEDNLTQYSETHGIGSNRVRAIVEDQQGVLWFGTRDGVTKLEDGNLRTFTTNHGLPDDRIRDLIINDDNVLWIASRGGLCRQERNQMDCYDEQDGLINNRIRSMSRDRNGNLWLGTEEGVSYFNGREFTNYSVDEGLANNIIYATHYDREGNIWFGSYGGGISLFLGDHLKNYTSGQGLPNNVVTSISEDRDGHPWIATYGGGIAELSSGKFDVYDADRGLVDNKVYTLEYTSDNQLLIGTRWGLSIYDGTNFLNFNKDELPYRKVRDVLKVEESNEIWMGTYGEGIIRYKEGSFRQYTEEDGLVNNTVLALKKTQDGSIWIATYGGISRLNGQEFTNYTITDGLPNNGVIDILEDDSGALWFATFGGIARFEQGSFKTITPEDGLPGNVFYFINKDDQGFYWIGTNKGVVRFDYDTFQLAKTDSAVHPFRLITQDQGLVANEMNAGASFKDSNGHLWFGSVDGLTQLDPSQLDTSRGPPKIHIENIRVSGEPISMKPNMEISSDNQNITFEFIGISFTAPEQVRYEYRLKNSGGEWQQTNRRTARYSSLMGGDYTFQVRARNNDGQWSTEIAEVQFRVLAPFWQQWWFIGLVVLILAAIIFFIYNYYRVRKMMEMERMRVQIASDLHDDVGSALTEIALQSDFLQTMDVNSKLQDSLQQIGNQSRKIVTSLDDIVWSIDARNDTVGDLTDRMQDYVNNVLPQKTIAYNFQGNMDKKLDVTLKENLYLIFKEAINNVAKHSNAQKVEVELRTDGDNFRMSIKDNGTTSSANRKSGQGMRNMNMRAKRIDADIMFNNDSGFEVYVKRES